MGTEVVELLRKQLEHLRELGVEGIRVSTETPKPRISTDPFEPIHQEIGDCTRCSLHEQRTHVVHTEGNR